jgi:hypothetical protein
VVDCRTCLCLTRFRALFGDKYHRLSLPLLIIAALGVTAFPYALSTRCLTGAGESFVAGD